MNAQIQEPMDLSSNLKKKLGKFDTNDKNKPTQFPKTKYSDQRIIDQPF